MSHGGKTVEQELADLGEGESIFAVNPTEGKLGEQISKKTLNVFGGRELAHAAEEEPGTRGVLAALTLEIFAR